MPHDASVVAAGSSRSSVISVRPTLSSTAHTLSVCWRVAFTGTTNVIEHSSATAMLGMASIRAGVRPPLSASHRAMSAEPTPAAITTTVCAERSSEPFISASTPSITHGLTTTNTTSAPVAAATLSVVVCAPSSAKGLSAASVRLATVMFPACHLPLFSRPLASEPPMAPAPMIAIFISMYLFFLLLLVLCHAGLAAVRPAGECRHCASRHFLSLATNSSAIALVKHSGGNRRRVLVPEHPVNTCSS